MTAFGDSGKKKITLAVKGKVVSGVSKVSPRKGYLALESEGSECHFRNLRIKELPSTAPKPEEIATDGTGFKRLYNGADLTNWKQEPGHKGHWVAKGPVLSYDGKSEAKDKDLWSEKSYGDLVLVCDWRLPARPKKMLRPIILPNGDYDTDSSGKQKMVEVDDAGDSGIYLRGSSKSQVNMWCWPIGSGEVYGYRTDKAQPAEVRAADGVVDQVDAVDDDLAVGAVGARRGGYFSGNLGHNASGVIRNFTTRCHASVMRRLSGLYPRL